MKKLQVLVCLAAAAPFAAQAVEQLREIRVEAESTLPMVPDAVLIDPEEIPAVRPTGDRLRDIPGVSGVRMGGHGVDPVVRGQGQGRVNVLLDGAYVHGGCPNRMDPATAYAPLETYDRVTLIKGAQTVLYGGGGSGGTLLLERRTERFQEGEGPRVRAGLGLRTNGRGPAAYADLAMGAAQGYVRFIGQYADVDSYEDGNGEEVRSAYEQRSGTLILGLTPDADTRVELELEASRSRDVLFAGAGMDSPDSDSDTYRLRLERAFEGPLGGVTAELYRSEVDHVMDNYSLREPRNPAMLMRAPSSSDTAGGRVIADLVTPWTAYWKVGVDHQRNQRDAVRVNDADGSLQSVLWPDTDIRQTGVFTELAVELGGRDRLVWGLRYDRVRADASKAYLDPPAVAMAGMDADMPMGSADMPMKSGATPLEAAGMAMEPGMPPPEGGAMPMDGGGMPMTMDPLSPKQLYRAAYGVRSLDRTEHNWGGLLRWEHRPAAWPGLVYVSLSRSVRTADATERFIASNAMGMGEDRMPGWVGNPAIDPEKHHQVEVGLSAGDGAWDLAVSAYYDRVDDFILRDMAEIPDLGGSTIVYRNVDAHLYGAELEAGLELGTHWSGRLGLGYVHAQNTTDDRPIAQIPPLEGYLGVEYARTRWSLGARARAAARQTRIDEASGLDVRKTPGWGVVDLYGEVRLGRHADLRLGVDNLFDRAYAQHLNKANAFDATQVQVNEPGRTLWLEVTARM